MFKNYLITALRQLAKNKWFSLINITGLAIGLTACFFISQYVWFERSYDQFHQHAHRLYRVSESIYHREEKINSFAPVTAAVAPAMKADFPEVAESCRFVPTSLFTSNLTSYVANSLEFSHVKSDGGLQSFYEEEVYFADPAFLSMFSFQLQQGDVNALTQPNTVVITERIAHKYFDDEPALGKELRLNTEMLLKVTGVLKDIPENSHLQFDILISFATVRNRVKDDIDSWWQWPVFHTYILLAPDAKISSLETKMPGFLRKYFGDESKSEYHTDYFFQPITDVHLHAPLRDEPSTPGDKATVYFLSLLAIFILVIAWINYINLTTAKSLDRSKEVSLRKVIGAQRKQLLLQFLFEAMLINFFAISLTFVLVAGSWHAFEALVGRPFPLGLVFESISHHGVEWLMMGVVFLLGVVLSSTYPALVLSSFIPAHALKGMPGKSRGVTLRKMMVSFQYVLALLLVAGTITIYRQLKFMRAQDPGFSKEQMLVVKAPAVYDSTAGDKISFFKNTLTELNNVGRVTATTDVPGKPIIEYSGARLAGGRENDDWGTYILSVDPEFFDTYNIKLLEGRMFNENETMSFRRKGEHESVKVLVNEEFVRQMKAKGARQFIHEKLDYWWGPEMRQAEIVGIVADHHQVSFKEQVKPIMYVQPEWTAWKYFSVSLAGGSYEKTIVDIKDAYVKSFPGSSFDYFFLDDFFDRQYNQDTQFGNIFNVFTALAIIVTCLGLIGLGIFSAGHRVKEIGIRKALGATESSILFLFSKEFLRVLIVSYAIALPVIYVGCSRWLEHFSFHISLTWLIFALPFLFLVTVTVLTMGSIALRAALASPLKALKHE